MAFFSRYPNRIRALRTERSWTMRELAERAGTTASQINKLEKSSTRLNAQWMQRIAEALGCRQADLLFEGAPRPVNIDERLARQAMNVANEVLRGEPEDVRDGAIIEIFCAVYDFLIECAREGRELDKTAIADLARMTKRSWQRRNG